MHFHCHHHETLCRTKNALKLGKTQPYFTYKPFSPHNYIFSCFIVLLWYLGSIMSQPREIKS